VQQGQKDHLKSAMAATHLLLPYMLHVGLRFVLSLFAHPLRISSTCMTFELSEDRQ